MADKSAYYCYFGRVGPGRGRGIPYASWHSVTQNIAQETPRLWELPQKVSASGCKIASCAVTSTRVVRLLRHSHGRRGNGRGFMLALKRIVLFGFLSIVAASGAACS